MPWRERIASTPWKNSKKAIAILPEARKIRGSILNIGINRERTQGT
jgi:hypothetical protein